MTVIHAEWTKLRTTPAGAWLTLGVAVLTLAAGLAAIASAHQMSCPSPATCFGDSTRLSLTGVWLGQAAAVALGVLAVSTEYATGVARTTLLASPQRLRVLAAKALLVVAGVSAAGVVGVAASLVSGRLLLPRDGFNAPAGGYLPVPLTEPTLRAAVGTVLYLILVALLSMGLAAVVRDTAAALGTMLIVLYAVPTLGLVFTDPAWQAALQLLAPMSAGMAMQSTVGIYTLPGSGPWAGLAVLTGYTAVALAAGALRWTRSDV